MAEVQFRSFSKARPKIEFAAGPDEETFEAYPVMPPTKLQEMLEVIKRVRSVGGDDSDRAARSFVMLREFFEQVLRDESYSRFVKKLEDVENGVQLEECMDIFQWLVECYGLRPTTSSPSSSAGLPSGGDGTSSTDGAQAKGSDPSS